MKESLYVTFSADYTQTRFVCFNVIKLLCVNSMGIKKCGQVKLDSAVNEFCYSFCFNLKILSDNIWFHCDIERLGIGDMITVVQ